MKSLGNGIIGDALGASRAIRIYWRKTDPESVIRIRKNTLTRAYGDDGDLIQIAQTNNVYSHSSQTIIEENDIAFGTRRLIKATASNVTLSKNTFRSMELDHPEGEGVIKTYMVAFGPFLGNLGPDQDFVLGSVIEDNIFDNTLGYEGTLGFVQTDGAIVKRNTFKSGRVTFARDTQNILIANNDFENSTIEMSWAPIVRGNTRVLNNRATINTQTPIDPIYGFFIMHPGAILEQMTIQGNTLTVIEDKTRTFFGFFHTKPNVTIGSLKLLENTLIRQKGDRSNTRSEFLYSFANFGAGSEVRGNRLFTDLDEPARGFYFRNVATPLLFDHSDNENSYSSQLIPTAGTDF